MVVLGKGGYLIGGTPPRFTNKGGLTKMIAYQFLGPRGLSNRGCLLILTKKLTCSIH